MKSMNEDTALVGLSEKLMQSLRATAENKESPQMRVGSGGASSMPPQQRNSIEINAPGEWKP